MCVRVQIVSYFTKVKFKLLTHVAVRRLPQRKMGPGLEQLPQSNSTGMLRLLGILTAVPKKVAIALIFRRTGSGSITRQTIGSSHLVLSCLLVLV